MDETQKFSGLVLNILQDGHILVGKLLLLNHSIPQIDRILNSDQFQKEDCEINSFMSGLNVS